MHTPLGNEIFIINATAVEKFSVGITVFQDRENWQRHWAGLRDYVRRSYRWEDVPSPAASPGDAIKSGTNGKQ
jgi:hypothetical protein